MSDILAIVNWELDVPLFVPHTADFAYHGYSTALAAGDAVTIDIPAGTVDGDHTILIVSPTGFNSAGGDPEFPSFDGPSWASLGYGFYGFTAWQRVWSTGDPTSVTVTASAWDGDATQMAVLVYSFAGISGAYQVGTASWSSGTQDPDITKILIPANTSGIATIYAGAVQENSGGGITADSPMNHVVTVDGPLGWLGAGWDQIDDGNPRYFSGVATAYGSARHALTIRLGVPDDPIYPDAALPFLSEFDQPLTNEDRYSPQSQPSIQYRDGVTGALLAVHPYPETPDYTEPLDPYGEVDTAYGPGASAITSDFVYLCGWNTAAIWKLRTNTNEQVWRLDGYQNGQPDPVTSSYSYCPVLSPDGSLLYLYDTSIGLYAAINTSDGSVASTTPSATFKVQRGGTVLAPDGSVFFTDNTEDATGRGVYRYDLATGAVLPILLLTSIGLGSYTSNYLYGYQMAAHPSGDGFAFVVQRYDGTYHSHIVECGWDGVVTNTYDYAASSLDGQRLAMFFAVCYSSDGNKLYSTGDTSWPIIWRFERGPGNIGGEAPWMHCDFLDRAAWEADGSPYSYGSPGAVLWYSTTAGIAAYSASESPCVPPANDNWADAEILFGDSDSTVGTNVCATAEVDEPSMADYQGTASVWYSWTPSADGEASIVISGDPDYRVVLEAFVGDDLPGLVGVALGGDVIFFSATGGTSYSIRVFTRPDRGEPIPFTLAWDLTPTPPVQPPRPIEEANIVPTGRLGCSRHVAYVQDKCNGPRFCELLDTSSIHYTRKLDEVSEATVVIPLGGDLASPCCSCLADVEPWCHQLTIVREGDGVVWTGPIQSIRYGRDQITIEAKDKLAWLQYRVNELNLEYLNNGPAEPGEPPNPNPGPYQPLTEIAEDIIILAMADSADGDSTCFLEDAQGRSLIIIPPGVNGNLSDGRPPGFGRKFLFEAFAGPTAYDDLVQVANAGLDFTVVNHNVILTGEDLPPRAIGTLTDGMILGDVDVIKDGTSMGNRFYIRYEGDDDPAQCLAQCNAGCLCVCPRCVDPPADPCYNVPCPAVKEIPDAEVGCYDRIERVIDGLSVTALDTATGIAERYLARGKIAPRLIELPSGTRLGPDCPWAINDMIPGQRVDVALSTLCFPVFQGFKLQSMDVTDDGTDEQITIDLLAVEQTGE